MKGLAVVVLALTLAVANFPGPCQGALQVGFYNGKCRNVDVEATIGAVVFRRYMEDITIVSALLRMQFHDCFVRGCDASILLDGNSTEKTAGPNRSVRGYDLIDQVKEKLERACPGVVSCADIIVAVTRDAVSFAGGMRYEIQTGRRDGLVSEASITYPNLPGPYVSVSNCIAVFMKKGLSPTDMVTLFGAHTVGNGHCALIKKRLYNFEGSGKSDPNMDTFLASSLREKCPENASVDGKVALDQGSFGNLVMDNGFYRQLLMKRGVLHIDQELALDPRTRGSVEALGFGFGFNFQSQFAEAMVKLGAIEVLTGQQGQIRRSCRSVN